MKPIVLSGVWQVLTTVVRPIAQSPAVNWCFDQAALGAPPPGFTFGRTGAGRPGHWVVRAVADAPSGSNVLAQEDSDRTDYRFPIAVADSPSFGDVSVSVRCKAISGRVDRACGIVWRYIDENNYYLTRANALEDNVCWYYVQNGRRIEVKRARVKVPSGVWHTLRADMRGVHIEVYFNDQKLIDVHDSRRREPGIVDVDQFLIVEIDFDVITAHVGAEGVPDPRRNLDASALDLDTPAVLNVVPAHVVFERIGSREVVVVFIDVPPDDAAGAIDAPADRLAPHGHTHVAERWRVGHR